MKLKLLTLVLAIGMFFMPLFGLDLARAQRDKRGTNHPATKRQWYVLVSPDGDFTITFPQRPDREPDEQGVANTLKSYGLYTQNGMRFSINFQTMPGYPNATVHDEWDDNYEQNLLAKDRLEKRRVVRTRRIGKNTFEAEIWDSNSETDESINYIRQTILRHGHVYTLLCGSEIYGRPLNKAVCRRFLGSLRFIDGTKNSSR